MESILGGLRLHSVTPIKISEYCSNLCCFQRLPCILHSQPHEEQQSKQAMTGAAKLDQGFIFSQFHVWYPLLRRWSIKSQTIELPVEFVRFLQQDGIVLPESLATTQAISAMDPSVAEMYDYDSDNEAFWKKVANEEPSKISKREKRDSKVHSVTDVNQTKEGEQTRSILEREKDEESDTSDDSDAEGWEGPFFPQVIDALSESIATLKGKVFPRLNWRSPRDASWINSDNTLACTKPGDVILLLKSSDLISHDLDLLASHNLPVCLNLRQWSNLSTANEFRCFVADGRLLGASQHARDYYPHLSNENWLYTVKLQISDFFQSVLLSRVPLRRYVFDAYFDTSSKKMFVLNFKPWHTEVDTVLFDWEELEKLANSEIKSSGSHGSSQTNFELRVIKEAFESTRTVGGIINRLPKDGIDLSDQTAINSFVERIAQVPTLVAGKMPSKV